MKKLILTLILISSILLVKSQVYLGISFARYKYLLSQDHIYYTETYERGDYYLTFTVNNISYSTVFVERGVSQVIVAMPKTRGSLNALVEKYNREAVVNDEGSWTLYLGNGDSPIDIRMMQVDKGIGYIFVYSNH